MENLGKVFRDFRLNGHYSLKEATGQFSRPLSCLVLSWVSRT